MTKYVLEVFAEFAQITVESDMSLVIMREMYDYCCSGIHCCVYDGKTGEILVIMNSPDYENYFAPEFSFLEP